METELDNKGKVQELLSNLKHIAKIDLILRDNREEIEKLDTLDQFLYGVELATQGHDIRSSFTYWIDNYKGDAKLVDKMAAQYDEIG